MLAADHSCGAEPVHNFITGFGEKRYNLLGPVCLIKVLTEIKYI